jgi:beta-glucosidase
MKPSVANTTNAICSVRPLVVLAILGLVAFAEFFLRDGSSVKAGILGITTSRNVEKATETKRIDDVVADWLSELSLKEKCDLLRGSVETHGYTGFVPGNARLGIPSLRMNDGPQGFRGPKRTSTAWPCGLSMATSFSPELVYTVAKANGKEFLGKGSNVLLGPGMNLARIARNGRNFEYICGEDPLLGEVMASAFIKGAQSNPGLIATAKHFVNNEQETDRTKVSAVVDEETEWNMYYRPFRASVLAGVESIMCSYNRVNGVQGCANEATIKRDLEGKMGFTGFVMSDWFAVTGTVDTAMAGTDVEMPIPLYYGDALKTAVETGKVPLEVVDAKVKRLLTTIVRRNMTEEPNPDISVNVSTAEHSILARVAASLSVVMLKNERDVLPLSAEGSLNILVIGDRAHDHVISTGGGSGHVHPPYIVTPLQGLQGGGKNHKFTYANTVQAMGLPDAVYQAADIVIACVGTSSTEGLDRASLSLDPNELDMIKQASTFSKKVIVTIVAPGAVLMPFMDNVRAVLLQFMPGQEAGNALADVVFGRVDPGGARLPITIPRRENERNMTKKQYPGMNFEQEYTERSEIGYRWYSAHRDIKPRVPFGFGLSYAKIMFLGVSVHAEENGDLIFHVGLVNTSKRKGSITPQVYITKYPDAVADKIAPVALIGFQRVELAQHEIKTVTIRVTPQSMSVWTKEKQDYFLFPGTYELAVGTSSADFWKRMTHKV